MSEHLQAQSVSRCVLGEPTQADRAHLAGCPQCRGEVDDFERALHGLRGSIHKWSQREFAAVTSHGISPVTRPVSRAAWSMAAILLLSIAGVHSFQQRRASPPSFADADSELIDNVRADMDRTVPRGMESLQALP